MVGEFDTSKDSWTSYCERFQLYFLANDVEGAEKQRSIFLTICGAATYQLIRNLVAPSKPTERTLTELIALVEQHHSPQPSVTVHRFKFNSRSQADGETVATFVAELRRLSEHCEYGDRLVCGVRDTHVQRRLLAEAKLTYKKAFDLAQAAELAAQNARELQAPPITVNAMQRASNASSNASSNERDRQQCYRCGGTQHRATHCRFKDFECRFCHKKGHLEKVCFANNKLTPLARSNRRPQRRPAQQVQVCHTEDDKQTATTSSDTTEAEAYSLFHTTRHQGPAEPVMISVKVNRADTEMELDTGASVSIMSEATYRTLWTPEQAPPFCNRALSNFATTRARAWQ